MAWAAHSKEGARKLGISQAKAKEWNKADQKTGILKKGGKKK